MAKARTREETIKLKDYAKKLFIHDGMPQKEIAAKTGVSEKSISKWVIEGEWHKLQRNFLLTREEQMANLLNELVEINEQVKNRPPGSRFADSKLADVRRKLIKDIKELETRNSSLPEAIATCKGLLDFVRKIELKTAQDLAKYVDAYIRSLL